jgi:membrane protein required for colicin V production
MTWLDWALIAVVGLSAVIGIWRGLVREVFALAGWVAAIAVAMLFAGEAANAIPVDFATPAVRTAVAFIALFLAILMAVSIVGLLFTRAVRAVGLGLADRTLGGVFGFARGALILLVLALAAGLTALPKQPFWREAKLAPPLETAAIAVKPYLPPALADKVRYGRQSGSQER